LSNRIDFAGSEIYALLEELDADSVEGVGDAGVDGAEFMAATRDERVKVSLVKLFELRSKAR